MCTKIYNLLSSTLTKIYIKLVPFFRKDCHGYISGNIELVPAKIPILKFFDQFGKIEVDLSCNNKTR